MFPVNKRKLSFDSRWLGFLAVCLRPIVKILVKNRVEFKSFINLARDLYVEEAESHIDQTSNNNRGKISSIAFQTGLDRREVSKSLKRKKGSRHLTEQNKFRESDIMDHWCSDPMFCDSKSNPLPLKRSGEGLSFETLVQKFGKNISHGPILNALIEANCVSIENGRVILKSKVYVPISTVDKHVIQIAGTAISQLANSIEHNLSTSQQQDKNFQRSIFATEISKQHIQDFKNGISELLKQQVCQLVIQKTEALERKYNTDDTEQQAKQMGVGLYFFNDN